MKTSLLRDHPLRVFFILLACCSGIAYYPILRSGKLLSGGGLWVLLLMWSPGLAALLARRLCPLPNLPGWRPSGFKFLAAGLLIPIVYAGAGYSLLWYLYPATWYTAAVTAQVASIGGSVGSFSLEILVQYVIFLLLFNLPQGLLLALGEELGWRGFLLPALREKFTALQASLLTGLVWSVYHYPAIFFADYQETRSASGVLFFTVSLTSASLLMGWLTLRSGSIWPAVLFHAVHNVAIQFFFDPLTRTDSTTAWLSGEFGLLLMIFILVSGLVAAWLLHRVPVVTNEPV